MSRGDSAFLLAACGLGLILSLLSATDLCSFGGCTDAHSYRLYRLPFPAVGVAFFGACALLLLGRKRFPAADTLLDGSLAAGAGAEGAFIYAQKYIIGAWCPLCLLIALTVALMGAARVRRALRDRREERMQKRNLWKFLAAAALCTAGFFGSLAGLAKVEAAPAGPDTVLGKAQSQVEVLIFTDWFCPACEKVEPVVLFTYPQLAQRARVQFIDKNIHRESANFMPYNLSFQVHEKAKYPALRRALADLARKTKNPTPEEVQKAAAPLGVTLKPLSFVEVTQAVADHEARIKEFKVNSTPTMVIRNIRTGKVRTLTSTGDMTSPKILKALQEVEQ
ncbi:MAG TPA: thioredoxin domain-containing protein [Verrucomicrobiae bacterium]|nr:thioredoxin domain-containing protein [Verrucomicrobiae bacterium]